MGYADVLSPELEPVLELGSELPLEAVPELVLPLAEAVVLPDISENKIKNTCEPLLTTLTEVRSDIKHVHWSKVGNA